MLSFIPIVGGLALALVLPVFVGSWMLAARKLEQGGTLVVGDLFTCLQGDRLTPPLVLGALRTMATWFAPALVVFHRTPPLQPVKTTFSAGLKNVVAFLPWGIVYLVAAGVASLPLGLGWIALAPVLLLTAYVASQDTSSG